MESSFSKTYAEARRRFLEAAAAVGGEIRSYPLETESSSELAIDAAIIGPEEAPTIVISSGVHGVEGFFGSAIQRAFLDRLRQTNTDSKIRYVLLHSINPFGFSRLRRFNEDNIDLNRNFLTDANDYQGAPEGYAEFDALLNPPSPPSRWEPFRLKAAWTIWRYGWESLKQSVVVGQYEFPQGLFFGGRGPSQSARIVAANCDSWIGASARIVHLDFHSGLGAFGAYQLWLAEAAGSPDHLWCENAFGADCVTPLIGEREGVAYQASGGFGEWMRERFAAREYRSLVAEFGTYGPIRVLGAIRAENRAYHYGAANSALYQSVQAELLECFCPRSPRWRKQVVQSGLKAIEQAERALLEDAS